MFRRLTLLFVFAIMLLISACQSKPTPASLPANATKLDVNKFAGHYEGTWTNSKTGASDPATFDFVIDEAARKVSLTLDMGGNYLGLGDPAPATIYATYDEYLARIQGRDVHFGDMDFTIDGDGNINGTFKNVAGGMVPLLTYTGKVGNGHIDTTYVVTLPNGSTTDAILVADRKQERDLIEQNLRSGRSCGSLRRFAFWSLRLDGAVTDTRLLLPHQQLNPLPRFQTLILRK